MVNRMFKSISVKLLALLLILLLTLGLSGCNVLYGVLMANIEKPLEQCIGEYTDYKYLQLNNWEKSVYTYLLESAQNGGYGCKVPVDSKDCENTLTRATFALADDHPELFWLKKGYNNSTVTSYSDKNIVADVKLVPYEYWADGKNLEADKEKLNAKIEQIIGLANEYEGDYEKALFIHDYIVQNTVYDTKALAESEKEEHSAESELIYTAYGCLVNGKAVCAGYAQAYKAVLDRLGIECIIIEGTADDISHAWNCVKIQNEYFLVDVTWADPIDYNGEYKIYDYFGLTDKQMAVDHTADTKLFTYPECVTTKYNYYEYYNLCLGSYTRKSTAEVIDAQKGQDSAVVKYSNESAYKKAVRDLLTNGNFYKIPSLSSYDTIKYLLYEDTYMIRFIKK